jgi:outer membrane biosynthesis protein TonB
MPRRRPAESFEAQLPAETERDWLAFAVSSLTHLLLIMVALLLAKRAAEQALDLPPSTAPKDMREVAMIYLPPPPRPQPLPPQPQPQPEPQPPAVTPPARATNRVPEPEPNALPEATRSEGTSEQAGTRVPQGDRNAPEDASVPETPEGVALEATMESEAKRIFGRKRGDPVEDAGPIAIRPLESSKVPGNPCGDIPTDSTGAPVQGVVQGVVRDVDGGGTLAGAHLQMIGQPYATFANNRGEFRLLFDIHLMADCRTQYVRIEAPGFRSQMLPIVIGGGVSTVGLRRR